MLLEKRTYFAVEHIGALEVRRVPGKLHAMKTRARDGSVDLLRQLGPDEAVLVAGEKHRWHAGRGVALDGRGLAPEPIAEVGGQGLVQAGDLRVEERPDRVLLAKRLAQRRVPDHRWSGRTG